MQSSADGPSLVFMYHYGRNKWRGVNYMYKSAQGSWLALGPAVGHP